MKSFASQTFAKNYRVSLQATKAFLKTRADYWFNFIVCHLVKKKGNTCGDQLQSPLKNNLKIRKANYYFSFIHIEINVDYT